MIVRGNKIAELIYGLLPSPFGRCLIAFTERGICKLAFMDAENDRAAVVAIRETWPEARIARDDAAARPYLRRIFGPGHGKTGYDRNRARAKPLPLVLKGTDFQMRVWQALRAIPEGRTARYADIASAIGSPKAVRAVGSACGRNPVGFLIPCHRVIASDGGLGGYRWGPKRKEAMLAWEAARK